MTVLKNKQRQKPRPTNKHFNIMRLWLAGVQAKEISEQMECTQQYVDQAVTRGLKEMGDMGAQEYLAILLQKVNLSLSQHTQVSRSLVLECIYLEQELKLIDHTTRQLAIKHRVTRVPEPYGIKKREAAKQLGQQQGNKRQLDAYYKAVEPLSEQRRKLRVQLIDVTKAINANNSSLVDTMVRMGVPAIAAKVNIESHVQGSIPIEIESDLLSGDESGLKDKIVESVDRQKKWLRSQVSKSDNEGSTD